MFWRLILGVSLLANLGLALWWYHASSPAATPPTAAPVTTESISVTNSRTAVIVRPQFFSWQELESSNYATYLKNLRAIGCPEETIRDILLADVNQMLREKYLSGFTAPKANPRWWTNFRANDGGRDEQASVTNFLEERNTIMTQLFGADWQKDYGRDPSATHPPSNQVLATLEADSSLRNLTADQKQLVVQVLSSAADSELESPAAVQATESSDWAALSTALSPDQLELVKLHFSSWAEQLREKLDGLFGFDTQPEEFRNIYRNTADLQTRLAALAGQSDDAANDERAALDTELETAIRNSLTPARYELYVRLNDPAYVSAMNEVKASERNVTPDTLALIYAIKREQNAEQQRIENDPTLTHSQREIELKQLELDQLKAVTLAYGDELPPEPETSTPPKPEPMKSHNVRPGEGLNQIADTYGVAPEVLRAANPNLNFDHLPAGTKINVPLRYLYPLPP